MTCFTRAKTTLQEHNLQLTHKMVMDDFMAFMGQMECGHLSIQQQLQNQAFITIQKKLGHLKICSKSNYYILW